MQRGDELRQVPGERRGSGEPAGDRVLAAQPAVHRPRPRESAGRHTPAEGCGHGRPEARGDPREPPVLPVHVVGGAPGARQAHDQLPAEAEHGVGGAGRGHLGHGKVRPSRQLPAQEPAHQRLVDPRRAVPRRPDGHAFLSRRGVGPSRRPGTIPGGGGRRPPGPEHAEGSRPVRGPSTQFPSSAPPFAPPAVPPPPVPTPPLGRDSLNGRTSCRQVAPSGGRTPSTR